MIMVLVLCHRLERACGCGAPSCCWSLWSLALIALAVRNRDKEQVSWAVRLLLVRIWRKCSNTPSSSVLTRWVDLAWIRHQASLNSPKAPIGRWCCFDAQLHVVRPLSLASCLASHKILSFWSWIASVQTIRKCQVILHFHLMEEDLLSSKVNQFEAFFQLSTVKRHTRQLKKSERIGLMIAIYPFWKCEKFPTAHCPCYFQSLSFSLTRSFPIALFWHLKSLIQRLAPLLDEEISWIFKEKC